RELSRKELVHPSPSASIQGELEYSFSHALVRDVCYAQIPRLERAERHRRAAAWIEGVAGDRVEDLAEILASHYLTGLALTRAGGTGPCGWTWRQRTATTPGRSNSCLGTIPAAHSCLLAKPRRSGS